MTRSPDSARDRVRGSNGLRGWVLSLPFVHEQISRQNDTTLREFVIDCPLLGIRRVWLLMRLTQPGSEVLTFLAQNDDDVHLLEFTSPGPGADPRHVEAAVLLAYQNAFAGSLP